MSKKGFFVLAIGIFLIVTWLPAAADIIIRIWLFQGAWMEGEPRLNQIEILSASSHPEFSRLKDMISGPISEFSAAATEALLDIKKLRTLDELFLSEKAWDEDRPGFSISVVGKQIAYRIDLALKKLSPEQVALRAIVLKTKEGTFPKAKTEKQELNQAYLATQDETKMEQIVDQGLRLEIDDPVIVGVPYKDQIYFIMVLLTPRKPDAQLEVPAKERPADEPAFVAAPEPISKVMPSYPDELKSHGVWGDVGLRITIDKKGKVEIVDVRAPLHPYLDYSAVRAFRQWTFEPVLRRGKPIRAAFSYVFSFDPRLYSEGHYWGEEAPEESHVSQEELRRILSGCAEYCRKLARSAFDYICEETIREIRRQLLAGLERSYLTAAVSQQEMFGPGLEIASRRNIQIFDSSRTEINDYSCDYQLIKKMDRIEERRILLKENGRKITDRIKLLEEKRYSVLRPIFESLQILDQDHQPLFNYNILEEESVHGKKAFVIKATPKSGDADGVRSAKIWIDKASFQIPKSEIEGIPLEGYDDVLKDAIRLNIDPVFVTTHEYQIERNGVLFPDSTSVRVEYRGVYPGARPVLKLKADLTYKKFKFFSVETEHQIIK